MEVDHKDSRSIRGLLHKRMLYLHELMDTYNDDMNKGDMQRNDSNINMVAAWKRELTSAGDYILDHLTE